VTWHRIIGERAPKKKQARSLMLKVASTYEDRWSPLRMDNVVVIKVFDFELTHISFTQNNNNNNYELTHISFMHSLSFSKKEIRNFLGEKSLSLPNLFKG
jgi:hypothetical protein